MLKKHYWFFTGMVDYDFSVFFLINAKCFGKKDAY